MDIKKLNYLSHSYMYIFYLNSFEILPIVYLLLNISNFYIFT